VKTMAIREILHYPDPRLRTVAKPVEVFDDSVRTLVKDMAETMYAAPGIGLAATQVDVHQRVIVIDVTPDKSDLKVIINPQLSELKGETVMEEGCLSVPGVFDNIQRAERVHLKALDENGQAYEMEAEGLLAVCIQHEIDHLDGKVFVDYLSPLKQQRIGKKLQKRQRVAL
jgi:peptide deformylase